MSSDYPLLPTAIILHQSKIRLANLLDSAQVVFFTLLYAIFKEQPQHANVPGKSVIAGTYWWAWLVSNQRPRPYQGRALTN